MFFYILLVLFLLQYEGENNENPLNTPRPIEISPGAIDYRLCAIEPEGNFTKTYKFKK